MKSIGSKSSTFYYFISNEIFFCTLVLKSFFFLIYVPLFSLSLFAATGLLVEMPVKLERLKSGVTTLFPLLKYRLGLQVLATSKLNTSSILMTPLLQR